MTTHRISKVTAIGPAQVAIRWLRGPQVELNLADPIRQRRGLKSLRDEQRFASVGVGEGGHSITWGDGLDMGADSLWRRTLLALGKDDAVEFNDWRMQHNLSLTDVAEALGLSRRMVAYYVSGQQPVPKTVLLACRGWELLNAA